MATKTLVANERFYYAGRNVEMGEEFECDETDVALLTHAIKPMAGVPTITPGKQADELGRTEKPDSETQGTRKGTYKRRDMKAED